MTNIVQMSGKHRHDQPGYFSLAELPQRKPIGESAFGTGWWELDQILKFYLGQFIVLTGMPGHGKSTFILNVLLNIAREQGIRSFMYVPENEAFLRHKLKMIWGNDLTFKHYAEDQCYIQSSTPDVYDQKPHTLEWVLDKAVVAIERDKCDVVLIDPWNEIEHAKPANMPLTDYIRECLMMLKQFCRCMNAVVIIVAHPTKAVSESGGRIPTLYDIEGSANWFNKCDNGLIVHRDPERDTCQVISAKVREIGAGKRGKAFFYVDPETGKYTPQTGAVFP